eukprot:CAMPEP_0117684928 /NCGR_PEP_ID=MMETSP0804-20121206/21427_1 /TAXON_ID=1074897 /ORGANISM="Tetraselmis astigmatica, Strain CCMP880" /LENGTH=150 /DNA_ID=CAMNT_0005496085 /DNA_START=242 /DNA_END=691 /DNA_ORIENTATION=-
MLPSGKTGAELPLVELHIAAPDDGSTMGRAAWERTTGDSSRVDDRRAANWDASQTTVPAPARRAALSAKVQALWLIRLAASFQPGLVVSSVCRPASHRHAADRGVAPLEERLAAVGRARARRGVSAVKADTYFILWTWAFKISSSATPLR